MLRAFSLAGARSDLVHLERLALEPAVLDRYDLVGFPGGFSYGDDIASGRIFAARVRETLYPALRRALERGCPMIGACNGFQIMVQVGLLPGPAPGQPWPAQPPPQAAALSDNEKARFIDRWIGMEFEPSSRCVWTAGIEEFYPPELREQILRFPIAHGEGRFVARDQGVLKDLAAHGQIALRYADNENGSQERIAGICDASGLVFGLMPHPERFLEWNRHPFWTRLDPAVLRLPTPGQLIFQNAVRAVTSRAGSALTAARAI